MRNRVKELRYVSASDLKEDKRNWRVHSQTQRRALETMLGRVGIADAVIARETADGLVLVDGHLRKDVLEGNSSVPVLIVDLSEEEAGEVLATLDPLAGMAGIDHDALQALLDDMPELPDDFDAYMSGLVNDGKPLDQTDVPTPDPPSTPVTQPRDVWILGNHRLLCGDSTKKADVDRVLDGATPRLMVTDPPYGVNYDPEWRLQASREGKINYPPKSLGKVTGDDKIAWGEVLRHVQPDVLYVWSPPGDHTLKFGSIIQQAGYEIRNQIIWAKPHFAISRGHYHYQHEPCWYAVRSGATARWIGDRSQSTVWQIANATFQGKGSRDEADISTKHGTQKPVECMERPIRNHKGDVYEPFSGSGTTLIAAERQGRKCYAIEIDPGYCDVAVTRWEQFTGGKATREVS